ncbi:MAG: GNAT family N-acetyltransferase [Fibrobacteres bacterium]|nr:GNAT family N-acetyltransferase [Fibrobacterota bacterium]
MYTLYNEIDNNQWAHFKHISSIGDLSYREFPSYSYIASGIGSWGNAIFNLQETSAETICEIKEKIIAKEIPNGIITSLCSSMDCWDDKLIPYGFERLHTNDGMALHIRTHSKYKTPEKLIIRRCTDEKMFLDWSRIANNFLFNCSNEDFISRFAKLIFTVYTKSDYTAFVGYVDDVPVASSACFINNGTGGIYLVAVHTEHRNQGYGTSITDACLEYGVNNGVYNYILHASEMGKYTYIKLGFESLGKRSRYRLNI